MGDKLKTVQPESDTSVNQRWSVEKCGAHEGEEGVCRYDRGRSASVWMLSVCAGPPRLAGCPSPQAEESHVTQGNV